MLGVYLLVMGILFVGVCYVFFKLNKPSQTVVLIGGCGMLCTILGTVFVVVETLLYFT